MKLTFCLPDGPTLGGVTTWTAEMCRNLAAKNRPVSLVEHVTFNPKLTMNLPKTIQRIDCTAGQHADSPFIKTTDIERFSAWYLKELPAVIVPNWSIGTYATCAQIAAETPQFLRVIGYGHTDEKLYYDWLAYYEAIIYRFVCVSDEIAANLAKRLPHRTDDIVTKPYAVNAPHILNRSYSSKSEPIKLIYAGRISQRQKRIFDLVPLIKKLAEQKVNFQLQIVGDGPEFDTLSKRLTAIDSDIQQRVTLEPGRLPDQMAKTWQAADVFLSVSEYEGTSIAMLEAMAQGCVPVVTQVSGTQAVITHGANGYSVPIGDMQQMAAAIKQLDQNRKSLVQIGEAAHKTIVNRFQYADYIDWFLQTADGLWHQPDRSWPANRPVIPPRLGAIKRADISGALSGDPASMRILQHKLLHATRLATPFYFMRGVAQKLLRQSPTN